IMSDQVFWKNIHATLREKNQELKLLIKAERKIEHDKEYAAAKKYVVPYISDVDEFRPVYGSLAAPFDCTSGRGFTCGTACEVARDLGFDCVVDIPTYSQKEYADRMEQRIYPVALVTPRDE
ncbi:MAG: hypothetical protein ACTSUE_25205, partial [Promethearchaeota archaeon]